VRDRKDRIRQNLVLIRTSRRRHQPRRPQIPFQSPALLGQREERLAEVPVEVTDERLARPRQRLIRVQIDRVDGIAGVVRKLTNKPGSAVILPREDRRRHALAETITPLDLLESTTPGDEVLPVLQVVLRMDLAPGTSRDHSLEKTCMLGWDAKEETVHNVGSIRPTPCARTVLKVDDALGIGNPRPSVSDLCEPQFDLIAAVVDVVVVVADLVSVAIGIAVQGPHQRLFGIVEPVARAAVALDPAVLPKHLEPAVAG